MLEKMDGLEKKITDIIEEVYNCISEVPIKATHDGDWYQATLYVHGPQYGGIIYATQCKTEEEFLQFIRKQLKKSRLDLTQHM